jgi:copper(I)-binding protein
VTRMTRRLLACAIVGLIPVLAGCEAGLNAPTVDFHPAAFGAYATSGGVTVSNAFVLGPAVNQSLSAGSDASMFLSITSSGGDQLEQITTSAAASVTLSGSPVGIPAGSSVNLTGPSPRIVLRDLSAPLSGGQDITVTLYFATAGQVQVQVPVQPHAYAYSTYDQPPPAPAPNATGTASTTVALSGTHHKKHHAVPTASPTPSVTP